MASVLQVGFALPSHLVAMRHAQKTALAMGHQVTTLLHSDVPITPQVLDRIALANVEVLCRDKPSVLDGPVSLEGIRSPEMTAMFLADYLLGDLPSRVATTQEVMRRVQPDVVFVEASVYEGAIAADRAGVPWISASAQWASLFAVDETLQHVPGVREVVAKRGATLEALGVSLQFSGVDVLSPHGNLVPGAPEWREPSAANITPIGYPLERQEGVTLARKYPEWPLVVVSFGSLLQLPPASIVTLAEAGRGMEVEFLVSAKGFAAASADLPPNFVCHDSIPQRAALEHAALIVTHGGVNSVLESLAFGVPQLVVPIYSDNFLNARIIERFGTGSSLDPVTMTPETARAALMRELATDRRAQTSARAEHLRRCDTSWVIREVVERALSGRRGGG